MSFKPWKALRIFAKVAKPLADIFGIRRKTVAGKVAEAAGVIEKAIPDQATPPSDEKPSP